MAIKPIGIFLAILVIAFVVGCTKVDPKEVYLGYVKKAADLKQYSVAYTIELNALKALGMGTMQVGIFQKDDNMKTVAEISVMGSMMTTYSYKIGSHVVDCTKGSFMGMGNADTVTCTPASASSANALANLTNVAQSQALMDELKDNMELKSATSRKIAGRDADCFTILVNNITKLAGSAITGMASGDKKAPEDVGTKGLFTVCFDKKAGVPLFINISSQTRSEVSGGLVNSDVMAFTATAFSETVDDSVFALPVAYGIIKSSCGQGDYVIAVQPFRDYSGPVAAGPYNGKDSPTAQVNVNFKAFQPYVISGKGSATEIAVCLDGACQEGYCYSQDKCLANTGNQAACQADPKCSFDEGVCATFSCTGVSDETACKAHKDCYWMSISGMGYCTEKSCYVYKTETECAGDTACEWSYSSCGAKSCYNQDTQAKCVGLKGCEWANDYCSQASCYNKQTEKACTDMGGCTWNDGYCSTDYSNY